MKKKSKHNKSIKESILSYAGKWKDMDEDVFNMLTKDLASMRKGSLLGTSLANQIEPKPTKSK